MHSNGAPAAMSEGKLASDPGEGDPATFVQAKNLIRELESAERLLLYAAEGGIEVDADVRQSVLNARIAIDNRLSLQIMDDLLAALTKLAMTLRPVTAESLEICAQAKEVAKVIRGYKKVALILACCIIPVSLATFVTAGLSDAIRKDIEIANKQAVTLGAELGLAQGTQTTASEQPGAGTLPQGVTHKEITIALQQFAATIRAIDARAAELHFFGAYQLADPFAAIRTNPEEMKKKFELPVPLSDPAGAAIQKIGVLQDVRYFAQSIQETVSIFYGAITTCILPVLYALLGACAFLLRSFEEQIKSRTFTPSNAHLAHFLIAAISGAVVGLFNNFTLTQSASIPPLAIAFLAGYAVDIFFTFLEGLLQTFSRGRTNAGAQVASAQAKG
jgi:hypothetical protein